MSDREALYEKLREKIRMCEMKYEADKNDSHLSVTRRSELETIQGFYERLTGGESCGTLLDELRKELPQLEWEREKEWEHPTFDWYDDHYYYKLFDGRCDAYQYMIELLQEETGGGENM